MPVIFICSNVAHWLLCKWLKYTLLIVFLQKEENENSMYKFALNNSVYN